ncbi:MAG: GDP-mannose 4,6-dehydratase [Actinobacteria bacterium]|nr:GDP-mannose 4,6-dehydratase [Actinomycetota bacterium]
MHRIFITGGAGFIGYSLNKKLLQAENDICVYDNLFNGRIENVPVQDGAKFVKGDILDEDLLEKSLKKFKPDIVIHLAALAFIPYCSEHPKETIRINIEGTQIVCDLATKYGASRLFFASTAAVYKVSDVAMSEDMELNPVEIYGLSKMAGEYIVKYASLKSGISMISTRFFNAYGPRETNPYVIPHLMEQLKNGETRIRLGNLEPKRDFIHTEDLTDAIISLINLNVDDHDVFNIGTGREYSVLEIVKYLQDAIGSKFEVIPDERFIRKIDRMHLLSDISKIIKATGWHPKKDLNEGLKELLFEK